MYRSLRPFSAVTSTLCVAFVLGATVALAQTPPAAVTGAPGAQPVPPTGPADAVTLPEVAEPRDMGAALDEEVAQLQERPGGLTAEAAASEALRVSFDIQAASERERAQESEVSAAKIRYAPRLNLTASYMRLSHVDSPVLGTLVAAPGANPGVLQPGQPLVAVPLQFPALQNQTQVKAQLVVPLTDYFLRFPQLLTASEHGRAGARYAAKAQRARTAAEAKLAYYAWARAVMQHVTTRQARERAVSHLADAQRAYDAGLATSADVRTVESQVAQAELLETRASNAVAITAEQLRVVLHRPSATELQIGERVVDVPPLPPVPSLEAAWTEAQGARPELLALTETEAQLRQQARAVTASEMPRLDALGELLTANPNPRYQPAQDEFKTTWAVGVQLSWTPNDWATGDAQRNGLEAQANATRAQTQAAREGLRADLVASLRGVEQARSTISAAERGVVSAEAAYRVRRDQYRAGRAKNVELTDAETELTRARIDYIDALIDARIAKVRMDYALGRLQP